MICEWCGHEHAREALCSARPKWSRRGFLAMFGAGVAGLAFGVPAPPSLGERIRRFVVVSEELIRDSAIPVERFVREELMKSMAQTMRSGFITPNEARNLFDLPPLRTE